MKKTFLSLTTVALLLGLSGCMPKTSSNSGGTSSSNTSASQAWWLTPTPTVTATYFYTPTVTPTPVYTATNSPCGDPLGDCSSSYPVINLPITKRGALNGSEAMNTYNSWNSSGLGFTTDGRLRLRVAVNTQPTSRSSCGLSGSYNPYFYTKLKARLSVKLNTGAEIWSTVTDSVSTSGVSPIYDVPVSNFPSAYPYIVTVSYVNTDSYCQYQTAMNGANYCNSHQAWCGCPAEAPDGTNCWSLNLHVVTSQTNNFK
ncbi:MAG: hypothetical protein ACOYL6_00925 [Bacteriovoracaceae bacterium]